ncbi:uncharacterized protein LOC126322407 [Schistocerca gregaria]|uniref:uncharacterized protein LOC126322407 n=1 Tax=Schistocerca gregaria TaxID=7010 RepID=UPI00211E6824|nr:uncharacterized protein LOC126322407 [Schistocerca gregaria]
MSLADSGEMSELGVSDPDLGTLFKGQWGNVHAIALSSTKCSVISMVSTVSTSLRIVLILVEEWSHRAIQELDSRKRLMNDCQVMSSVKANMLKLINISTGIPPIPTRSEMDEKTVVDALNLCGQWMKKTAKVVRTIVSVWREFKKLKSMTKRDDDQARKSAVSVEVYVASLLDVFTFLVPSINLFPLLENVLLELAVSSETLSMTIFSFLKWIVSIEESAAKSPDASKRRSVVEFFLSLILSLSSAQKSVLSHAQVLSPPTVKSALMMPLSAYKHPEYQYLGLVYRVLSHGRLVSDERTKTGALTTFGNTLRFNLSAPHSFPLLTTKKMFWRGIVEELLFFIRGDTNSRHLSDRNVHIWDANSTRSFLDSRGLFSREENDLGPIYGFQWRHFGAKYIDMHADYTGQGIDQLAKCIDQIKNDPSSRRIVLTAWNPSDLDLMALPPCHILCQFNVLDQRLSCLVFQRSCDVGLGLPFNIASYALFTLMIAHVCHLQPGDLIYTLGNTHIYSSHVSTLETQLMRIPKPWPTVLLNPSVTDIDKFTPEDITLKDYEHLGPLNMAMAI